MNDYKDTKLNKISHYAIFTCDVYMINNQNITLLNNKPRSTYTAISKKVRFLRF